MLLNKKAIAAISNGLFYIRNILYKMGSAGYSRHVVAPAFHPWPPLYHPSRRVGYPLSRAAQGAARLCLLSCKFVHN